MGNNRKKVEAVFLDRDGVINPSIGFDQFGNSESPFTDGDFVIFPTIGSSIAILNALGYLVIIATNQPSIAKGKTTFAEIQKMHLRLISEVENQGLFISDICICPHHPDPKQVVIPELLRDCECRKPKPGMLVISAQKFDIDLQNSWMVGDSWKDVLAGMKAGCKTILVSPTAEHLSLCTPTHTAKDLTDAVEIIRRNTS